jgi:hypothetical protein
MTMPDGMYAKTPARPEKEGRQPRLLTDEKVRVLLATPNTWYVIGQSNNYISGTVKNIMSFEQQSIKHLKGLGNFKVVQRKDKVNNVIDIYCKWVPITDEEE